MKMFFKIMAASAITWGGLAQAHTVLEYQVATAGQSYKASFKVSHGCGHSPTRQIVVDIPAGVQGAKPMPKPGWTLAVSTGPLATPYDDHGTQVTQGVTAITWTASPGNALPDAHYDEFVLRGGLPATAGPMWFKVLQSCAQGQTDWAEIPATGSSTRGLKRPAALLEIIPSEHVGHAH